MSSNPSEMVQAKEGSVLLVDDQPEQIDIIKSALEQYFVIKVSVKGKLVFQVCRAGVIDLILLDVMMPGMNGYEICRQLKNNPATREIPVIFLTGKDSQYDEAVGLQLGAVDFIRKPSSPSVVLTRCRNTIAHQRAKMALRQKNGELQQALEELQQTMRIREDMERISRHDLKGPLSSIIGVPELLLEDGNLTEQQRKLLKMVEKSGYTLLEMINRSLDLFKMENGTYHAQLEAIDLSPILQRIADDLGSRIDRQGISIVLGDANLATLPGPFLIMGEKMLCYPLFYNLALNAVEASCQNGQVAIRMATDGAFSTVRITNAGEVPETIRAHFFDKYVTSGKEGGTGLGTYSALLAARTQGGRIELDTSQAGATSVLVTLPSPPPGP
ncbi:MAG: response regulator [Magnetococcales bacterium]|nr:response regulator [Magnetococcales bacterium]